MEPGPAGQGEVPPLPREREQGMVWVWDLAAGKAAWRALGSLRGSVPSLKCCHGKGFSSTNWRRKIVL